MTKSIAPFQESLKPFHKELSRIPEYDDRERLLNIPIRRISRFDLDKNQEEIAKTQGLLAKVEKELKHIKKYTIQYLKGLINKYGKDYVRKTQIQTIGQIDRRSIETRKGQGGLRSGYGLCGIESRQSDHV